MYVFMSFNLIFGRLYYKRAFCVIGSPDDASVWLALARSYAAADTEKHGMFSNEQILRGFINAFERALTIDPNDASLHAEFANDLLWAYRSDDYYKALISNEVATALALDPNNADAKSALDFMNQQFPNSILPTPGPFPIFIPATPTLEPTALNLLNPPLHCHPPHLAARQH